MIRNTLPIEILLFGVMGVVFIVGLGLVREVRGLRQDVRRAAADVEAALQSQTDAMGAEEDQ